MRSAGNPRSRGASVGRDPSSLRARVGRLTESLRDIRKRHLEDDVRDEGVPLEFGELFEGAESGGCGKHAVDTRCEELLVDVSPLELVDDRIDDARDRGDEAAIPDRMIDEERMRAVDRALGDASRVVGEPKQ